MNSDMRVDQDKVKAIRRVIYGRVYLNARKTRPQKNKQMEKEILHIIQREVDKCF